MQRTNEINFILDCIQAYKINIKGNAQLSSKSRNDDQGIFSRHPKEDNDRICW